MANIFANYMQPVRSVADYAADYDLADARKAQIAAQTNQNALHGLALQQQTQAFGRQQAAQNALQRIASGWTATTTDEQRASDLMNSGIPELAAQADTLRTAALKRTETDALAAKNRADAGKTNWQMVREMTGVIAANPRRMTVQAMLSHYAQTTGQPVDKVASIFAEAGDDPAAIRRVALGIGLDAEKQLPKVETHNVGGSTVTQAVDPITGKPTVTGTIANTQSPDNRATNATSRANNRDTIAGENLRAGVGPGGTLDDNTERTAQAIASGQLPAPTGMALLNPKNQRILGRVMEINPQYDSTTVDAKKKAARDFTTGTQGNAMRSFAVAGYHLDQLGQLADALGNGNLQIVNKIGNAYAAQTGNPAPTNFEAAKEVVSKEVIKAIVAGGGGVAERQELSNLMSNAKSLPQLKGIITQYRNLMAAQHDALLQQRRAAGLSDSTLPAYSNDGQGNADLHRQADAIIKGK